MKDIDHRVTPQLIAKVQAERDQENAEIMAVARAAGLEDLSLFLKRLQTNKATKRDKLTARER